MSAKVWRPADGPQTAFLASAVREVLYGGAAGGGKTDALLAAPLRWANNPNHSAIILRRTRPQLQEVIDRSKELYEDIAPGAIWSEVRSRWTFPSGARIRMGFAEHTDDILNFKSDQYNWIGFDELTSFEEKSYLFMLSRNRTIDPTLPLQIRAATNPGDIGHAWVYERFIEKRKPYKVYKHEINVRGMKPISMTRQYIPATVFDNPFLADRDQYVAGLQAMGEELAAAMLYGEWTVFEGQFFRKLPEQVAHRQLDNNYYIIRTMDYGYIDPTAVYWMVVYPRLNEIHIIEELYVSEVTVGDIAALIQRREQSIVESTPFKQPPVVSVADPTMFNQVGGQQSIADIIQRNGVWFTKANNDRPAGWAMMRQLLGAGRLKVWQGKAPMLYKTLPSIQYHPKKKDDIKPGGQDHAADSVRYGVVAFYEGGEVVQAASRVNPAVQDTVLPKLLENIRRQGQRDPMVEWGAGLL